MNDNTEISMDLLYEAILCLKTKEECAEFFSDLCTPLELSSISQRLVVAKLLGDRKVYSTIARATGASTATISRVNRTINGKYSGRGYEIVLERLAEKGIELDMGDEA
ncbi:MAG: hypothetical protein IKR73_03985 [Oscillospiraceae bacterium]|nr:hypothetical protein [Oscillospiraceae bacterium]